MHELFFWNTWKTIHKILFLIALTLFTSSILIFICSEYFAKNAGLEWEVVTEVKAFKLLIDTFSKGLFQFPIEASNQYVYQGYTGSAKPFSETYSYLIIIAIAIALVSGSVTIAYTFGLGYYFALTAFGAFFYFLNIDVLEVFGLLNKFWTIGWFLLYGILIHYYHAFRPLTPIGNRFLVFIIITTTFLFTTIYFSPISEPVRHLASYGWFSPFFLSICYILVISTDIIAGFLYITSNTRHAKSYSSLLNFLLVSLFFIGNIVLTFLKNRGSLDWNIFYINAPILLICCSILSIWSQKKKEPSYNFVAEFNPATSIWNLSLGSICLLCYAFANFSGNDPLQEVFEDIVIFSQLTFGAMFIIYVVANFMGLMGQGLSVFAVLYKPKFMPFGFVRIIGIIGIISIVLYNNNYQYRQTKAGYYLNIAESFLAEGNQSLGEEYLKSALSFDEGNHRTNYMLAMLLHQKSKDDIMAKVYLKQSMFKNPSPQSYASLGYFFLEEGDMIRSLEILREGKVKFPKSSEIFNNLALVFSKTDIHDSTFFYFKKAKDLSTDHVASANLLAFTIDRNIAPDLENGNIPNDLIYQTNLLALLNKVKKPYLKEFNTDFLKDTALTNLQASHIVNLSFNVLQDTTRFKVSWFDSLLSKSGNAIFYEDFMQAKAFKLYYSNKIAEAIVTLDQLQSTGAGTINYNNILANWLIQQDAYKVAMDFLSKAKEAGDRNATLGLAIAASFGLEGKEALDYWNDPSLSGDTTFNQIVKGLNNRQINTYTLGILPQLIGNPEVLYKAFYTIPDNEDKNKVMGRLMMYYNTKQPEYSVRIYDDKRATAESNWEYLRALKKLGQRKDASVRIDNRLDQSKVDYIKAWTLEISDTSKAKEIYRNALVSNPVWEEGVIDALRFLSTRQSREETYSMVLKCVTINPYSIELQKLYALQAIEMNLFSFADYSVEKLKDLMDKTEFVRFEQQIKVKKQEVTSKMNWN